MHFLYFVRVKGVKNSEEARNRANDLLQDNNFAGGEGWWGGGKSDWYVIGGRWSAELQKLKMKKNFFKEIKKLIPSEHDWGYNSEEIEKNSEAFQKLWEKLGGTGNNPYARDGYKLLGEDDDAMKMTAPLAKKLIASKELSGVEVAVFDEDGCMEDECEVKDLKQKDLVGSWLVVVDYHN